MKRSTLIVIGIIAAVIGSVAGLRMTHKGGSSGNPTLVGAEPSKWRSISHEGVTIDIPADWVVKKVKAPRVFDVDKGAIGLAVIRELKDEMGVEDLEEYFEFKFERISEGWREKRFGQKKSFTIHGRKAILIEGSATVEEPKDWPHTFYFMTVEGDEYYYFAYLLNAGKGVQVMHPELRTILESLKVP